jgi:uncharacterized membrane protein YeaQ/YmgE (transglycosylase-associated protein family)
MGIFTWIILGLVAGDIAKLLMPGRDPGGWFVTIILGIVGALLGGWIGRALLQPSEHRPRSPRFNSPFVHQSDDGRTGASEEGNDAAHSFILETAPQYS